jgi:hypothetical protein
VFTRQDDGDKRGRNLIRVMYKESLKEGTKSVTNEFKNRMREDSWCHSTCGGIPSFSWPAIVDVRKCRHRRKKWGRTEDFSAGEAGRPLSILLFLSSRSARCFSRASFISLCRAYSSSSDCFSLASFSATFCWKTIFISASILASLASCRIRSSCNLAAGLQTPVSNSRNPKPVDILDFFEHRGILGDTHAEKFFCSPVLVEDIICILP